MLKIWWTVAWRTLGKVSFAHPPSQLVTKSSMAYQPDPRDVKQLVTLSHCAVQWLWGGWGSSDDLLGATRTVFLFDLSSWASSSHDGLRAASRDNLADGLRECRQKLKGLLGPQLRNSNITFTACDRSRPAVQEALHLLMEEVVKYLGPYLM